MIEYRDHCNGILQCGIKTGLNLNTAKEQDGGQWVENYREDSC